MMDSFWCIQSLMSACFKLEKKFIIYACLSKDQQVFIIIDSNRSTSVQINWCIISYPKLKFNEMFIVIKAVSGENLYLFIASLI